MHRGHSLLFLSFPVMTPKELQDRWEDEATNLCSSLSLLLLFSSVLFISAPPFYASLIAGNQNKGSRFVCTQKEREKLFKRRKNENNIFEKQTELNTLFMSIQE